MILDKYNWGHTLVDLYVKIQKINLQLIIDKMLFDQNNYIFCDCYIVCRVFWLLLVLSAITLFSYILVSRCLHYFDYPSAVNVEILYPPSVPFPAITICNQNFMRYVTNKTKWCECVKYCKTKNWQLSIITRLRRVFEKLKKTLNSVSCFKCGWLVNSSHTHLLSHNGGGISLRKAPQKDILAPH